MGVNSKQNTLLSGEINQLKEYTDIEKNMLVSCLKEITKQSVNDIINKLEEPGIINNYLQQVGSEQNMNILPDTSQYAIINDYIYKIILNLSDTFKTLNFDTAEYADNGHVVDCFISRSLQSPESINKPEGLHIYNQPDENGNLGHIKISIGENKYIYIGFKTKRDIEKNMNIAEKTDIVGLHNFHKNKETEIITGSQSIQGKYTDALTGLHNVGFAQTLLNKESHNFSFIFFDVADFKHINDTYGHVIGDKILAEMGKIIKKTMRPGDYPVRVGGDEMGLIIDNGNETDPNKISAQLKKIERRINAAFKEINIADLDISIVTAHAVSTPDKSKSLEELKEEADGKLVKGEDGKRNRIEKGVGEDLSEISVVTLLNDLIHKYDRIPALLFPILLKNIERLSTIRLHKETNPKYISQLGHDPESEEYVLGLSDHLLDQHKKNKRDN